MMVGEVKGSGARNIQPAWRERVKGWGRIKTARFKRQEKRE
jgi:hypothetical protein